MALWVVIAIHHDTDDVRGHGPYIDREDAEDQATRIREAAGPETDDVDFYRTRVIPLQTGPVQLSDYLMREDD